MTHACRNCGSTDIRGTELLVTARRPWHPGAEWRFELRVCANCGLSDLFLSAAELDWAKEALSPITATVDPSQPPSK